MSNELPEGFEIDDAPALPTGGVAVAPPAPEAVPAATPPPTAAAPEETAPSDEGTADLPSGFVVDDGTFRPQLHDSTVLPAGFQIDGEAAPDAAKPTPDDPDASWLKDKAARFGQGLVTMPIQGAEGLARSFGKSAGGLTQQINLSEADALAGKRAEYTEDFQGMESRKRDKDFSSALANGGGQFVGGVITSLIPEAGVPLTLATASGQLYQQTYDDAYAGFLKQGLSPMTASQKAHEAGLMDMPVGVLDALSSKFLVSGSKIIKAVAPEVAVPRLAKFMTQTLFAAGSQGAQQAIANQIASGTGYDPDRPASEGVAQAAAIGGILAAPVAGLETALHPAEAPAAQTVPESPRTLQTQQGELVAGKRDAMVFPTGTPELPLPDGFDRLETPAGVFHYNPAEIAPKQIHLAVDTGTLGDLLDYGIPSKPDLAQPHTAVVRRDAQGHEIEAVVTDAEHLPDVLAKQGERAEPGQSIATEAPGKVIAERQAVDGEISPEQLRAQERSRALAMVTPHVPIEFPVRADVTEEHLAAEDAARKEAHTEAFGDRETLLDAVQSSGGLPTKDAVLGGELRNLKNFRDKGLMMRLFRKNAKSLSQLREALAERGFHYETESEMLDAVEGTIRTNRPVYGFSRRGRSTPTDPEMFGEETPFNLAGETTEDGARIQQEKDAEAAKTTEAASRQDDLFGEKPIRLRLSPTPEAPRRAGDPLVFRRLADRFKAVVKTPIDIIERPEDLPATQTGDASRAALREGKIVEAFHDEETGRVVIYLPELLRAKNPQQRMGEIVFHEAIGHEGLPAIYGGRESGRYAKTMDAAWDYFGKDGRAEAFAKAAGYRDFDAFVHEYTDGNTRLVDGAGRLTAEGRRFIAEELIARSAEDYGKLLPGARPAWYRRLADDIRYWFRQAMGRELSDRDLETILRQAMDEVRSRSGRTETEGGVRMARRGPDDARGDRRVQAGEDLFRRMGIEAGPVYADYPSLLKKHPDQFASAADVRAHVEFVLSHPDFVLPGGEADHRLLVRTEEGVRDRAVALEIELRGGKYRVKSAYVLTPGQLVAKMKKAAKPDATSGASRVNPAEPETPSRLLGEPRDPSPGDKGEDTPPRFSRQGPTADEARDPAALQTHLNQFDHELRSLGQQSEKVRADLRKHVVRDENGQGMGVEDIDPAGHVAYLKEKLEGLAAQIADLKDRRLDVSVRLSEMLADPAGRTDDTAGAPPTPDDVGTVHPWRLTKAFLGTADVFQKTKGLEFLASAIRKHVDGARRYQGELLAPFRAWDKGTSRAAKKAAYKEFEAYHGAADNGRRDEAAAVRDGASEAGRKLIDLWAAASEKTGTINQKNGLVVWDPKLANGTGAFRTVGKVKNYFPRTLRQDVWEALQAPNKFPKKFAEVLAELHAGGFIKAGPLDPEGARQEALGKINSVYASDFSTDHFGNIEAARVLKLPASLYDYSFAGARRYLMRWSERMAQIEAFGQKVRGMGYDLFDLALERLDEASMKGNIDRADAAATARYVNAVRDRAYGVTYRGPIWQAMSVLNSIATGTQLANPVTVGTNLLSGTGYNFTFFGNRAAAEGLAELRTLRRLLGEIRDGVERGVIQDDLMQMAHDAEGYASTVGTAARDFANFAMKYSGFNGSEYFVRAHTLATGKAFLRQALRAWESNPEGNAANQFRAWFTRNHFDIDQLIDEKGTGPHTDAFLRSAVNQVQGGYRYDQVPAWMDTPAGRFFFKYQKWGSQMSRNLYNNVLLPAIKGTEIKTTENGKAVIKTVRSFAPLAQFVVTAGLIGVAQDELKELLFGIPDRSASFHEISKTLDDHFARGMSLIFQRYTTHVINAGALGTLGNYFQVVRDVAERSRFKNPMAPPALGVLAPAYELALRAFEQGTLTAKDFSDFLVSQTSQYRTLKAGAARLLAAVAPQLAEHNAELRRQDLVWMRTVTGRFADEIGTRVNKTTFERIGKNPSTPYTDAINQALLVGDREAARQAVKDYLATVPKDEQVDLLRRIQDSVRARQPIRVGASNSAAAKDLFLSWAQRRLAPEDVERIRAIDRDYQTTAVAIGLLKPGKEISDEALEKALGKLQFGQPEADRKAMGHQLLHHR